MRNPADASGTPDLCLCQVISQLMVSISLSVSMTGARTELPVLQTWKVTRYHRGQHKAKVFLFVFLEMKVLWQMYTKVQSFIHIYTHPQPPWRSKRVNGKDPLTKGLSSRFLVKTEADKQQGSREVVSRSDAPDLRYQWDTLCDIMKGWYPELCVWTFTSWTAEWVK